MLFRSVSQSRYVNTDLWVFYKQLLVIPWVLAGKNGYFAHAFTVFEVSIFMIVFIYLFLRSLMLSRASSIMGSVVVCIGYSTTVFSFSFSFSFSPSSMVPSSALASNSTSESESRLSRPNIVTGKQIGRAHV